MAVPQNTLPIHSAFGREGDAVRMHRKGLDARQVVPRNGHNRSLQGASIFSFVILNLQFVIAIPPPQ